MTWENQRKPATTRPVSTEIDEGLWIVDWRAGTYIVKRTKGTTYKIYRKGVQGPIHIHEEQAGYGKEEAIRWIEDFSM